MKKILSAVLAAAMILSLTACGSSSSGSASGSGSGQAAETTKAAVQIAEVNVGSNDAKAEVTTEEKVIDETKKRELVAGIEKEGSCLVPWDPNKAAANASNPALMNIYEAAFEYTRDGGVKPLLAKSYEVNDDYTVWTIHFRDDVHFSNGDPMTADDVVWSYTMIQDIPISKTIWYYFEEAVKVDDYTVEVHLSQPYQPLLRSALTGCRGLIASKKHWEEVGETYDGYYADPIGTGPYVLEEYKLKERQVFVKNPNYWNKAEIDPFYEKITLKYLTDQNTQMLALENNEIDVLLYAKIPPLLQLPANTDIEFNVTQSSGHIWLQMNENKGNPTSDINIRKAIACCINKDDMNQVVYEGYSKPADTSACDFFTGAPKREDITAWIPEYNKEEAKKYLEAAGYNGEEIILLCVSGSMPEQCAVILQGELLSIGMNCSVKALDNASVNAQSKLPEGWSCQIQTATSSAMDYSWIATYQSYDAKTAAGFAAPMVRNEELEDLFAKQSSEFDEEARSKMFARIESIMNEDVQRIPIIENYSTCAYHNWVKGVDARPVEYLYYFKYWY